MHLSSYTHTCIQQVQVSAQYLGSYSGEGGALRDVFGYLQSLYPQGSKYQLLLGRTHVGFVKGGLMDLGSKEEGVAAQGWESKGKTYRNLSRAQISHTIDLFYTVS